MILWNVFEDCFPPSVKASCLFIKTICRNCMYDIQQYQSHKNIFFFFLPSGRTVGLYYGVLFLISFNGMKDPLRELQSRLKRKNPSAILQIMLFISRSIYPLYKLKYQARSCIIFSAILRKTFNNIDIVSPRSCGVLSYNQDKSSLFWPSPMHSTGRK